MSPDLHNLTGAYAVDALAGDEAAEFETHLRGCEECRQEARELRATAAAMGWAEYAEPPARLKETVLRAASETRQLPPGGVHAAVVDLTERRRSRLMLTIAASVAALAIVGGAVAGGIAWRVDRHSHSIEATSAQIAAILSAPDARTITGNGPDGSHATAVVSQLKDAAVFTGSGWPKAPGTHVLQLWVIDTSGAHSRGLLTWKSDGSLAPTIAGGLPTSGGNLGVTIEPAGGSKAPTTTPVLLMPLQS
jgi:anti-sigma-K factor RskA